MNVDYQIIKINSVIFTKMDKNFMLNFKLGFVKFDFNFTLKYLPIQPLVIFILLPNFLRRASKIFYNSDIIIIKSYLNYNFIIKYIKKFKNK